MQGHVKPTRRATFPRVWPILIKNCQQTSINKLRERKKNTPLDLSCRPWARLDLFLSSKGPYISSLNAPLLQAEKNPSGIPCFQCFFVARHSGESTSTLDSRDAPSLTAISTGSNLHELLGECKRCNKNASNKKTDAFLARWKVGNEHVRWDGNLEKSWVHPYPHWCCQQSWGRAPANHVLGFGNPQAACPKQCLARVLWWFNSRTCKGLVQKVPVKDGKSFRPNPQRQDQGVNFGFTCP